MNNRFSLDMNKGRYVFFSVKSFALKYSIEMYQNIYEMLPLQLNDPKMHQNILFIQLFYTCICRNDKLLS